MEEDFAGYPFERVGAIQLERDRWGVLIEERPGPPRNAPLHRYGEGPFCRFRIAQERQWWRGGVYVLTCGGTVRYVGTCENLSTIWNSVGRISPSARYKGGQQTHCRINALILNEGKQEREVALWFHAVEGDTGRKARKIRLVDTLNPPWNRSSPILRPSPSKAQVPSRAQAQSAVASAARPIREGHAVATERCFAGLPFSYVGAIRLERDERGEVSGLLPQYRYHNEHNLPLHKYGRGPFCRFRVALGWPRSGIYVLGNGDDPLYIGECQNLEDRWGTNGYGHISPRNCYTRGQETNCRINNLIYRETKTGAGFDLWFHPVEGDKHARLAVESELVAVLEPPWNR